MKLTEILCSVHIVEALTTRVNVQWSQTDEALTGIGQVEGVNFTLTIASITFQQYNGCNLSFSTEKDGGRIETFRNEFGQQSSKIIGAVVNGFKDKLSEYQFDFLVLVAKNSVDKRASLYRLIADRFAASSNMHVKQIDYGGDRVVIMIDNSVPLSVFSELQKSLHTN